MPRCAPTGLAILALIAGCTQFPELDATVTPELRAAAYPKLVPLEPLLQPTGRPAQDVAQIQADISARVAALRARAQRLRGPVLSAADRARLARRPGR